MLPYTSDFIILSWAAKLINLHSENLKIVKKWSNIHNPRSETSYLGDDLLTPGRDWLVNEALWWSRCWRKLYSVDGSRIVDRERK